jgi:hypothetical protein
MSVTFKFLFTLAMFTEKIHYATTLRNNLSQLPWVMQQQIGVFLFVIALPK